MTNHETFRGHHCTGDSDRFNTSCTEIQKISYLIYGSEDSVARNSAVRYHIQNCTEFKEHGADSVWPSDGHPNDTDQGCGVISLVTILTGNPPDNLFSRHDGGSGPRPFLRDSSITLRHTTFCRSSLDDCVQQSQEIDMHSHTGFRTHNPSKRAATRNGPPVSAHSWNRTPLHRYWIFNNSMDYGAPCDILTFWRPMSTIVDVPHG